MHARRSHWSSPSLQYSLRRARRWLQYGCSGDESTALLSGLLDTLRTQASGRLDEIARKGMLTPAASEEVRQVAVAYLQDT